MAVMPPHKRRKLNEPLERPPASAYLQTYRIRGIPLGYGYDQAISLLQDLPILAYSIIAIESLATEAGKKSQTATATFDPVPDKLGSNMNEWNYKLPANHDEITYQGDESSTADKSIHVTIDSHFLGITTLKSIADMSKHELDIIAITGLGGHAFGSFKERAGTHMWLRDSLPKDLPGSRIMIYGFDTRLYGSHSSQDLESLASTLRTCLYSRQQSLESSQPVPIVFIAYSLGGLVVKEAIIQMGKDAKSLEVLKSIYGILFFGVPNQGLDIGSLIPMVEGQPNEMFLRTLSKDTQLLRNQCRDFYRTFDLQDSEVFCFYETVESRSAIKENSSWKMKGPYVTLVDVRSATHGRHWEHEPHHIQGLHKMHSELVKFSRRDPNYDLVLTKLRDFNSRAGNVIQNRFNASTNWNAPQELAIRQQESLLDSFRVPFYLSEAPEIDCFVGRESTMSSMAQILLPPSKPQRKVVVLHGLGGIGKTQSAFRYAINHQQEYNAILWFNAKDEDSLRQSFQKNAGRLPAGAIPQALLDDLHTTLDLQKLEQAVKRWLAIPQNNQWLLIFDNYDNPKIPQNKDSSAYDIRHYFPEAYHGSIILTTRWANLKFGKSIPVLKLEDQEHALSILAETSGRPDIRNGEPRSVYYCEIFFIDSRSEPDILDLVEALDGLPLVLATAGSYLSLQSVSITKYLQRYQQSWSDLQQTSLELLSYEDRTLYSTWNLSYEYVRQQDKAAANLLHLWSYFDNQDLWYELLSAGRNDAPAWLRHLIKSEIAFDTAMRKLHEHGLIHSLKSSGGYGMHHCVHAWTSNVLDDNLKESELNFALCCIGYMVPTGPRIGDSVLQRRLLPHANRCLRLLAQNDQTDTMSALNAVNNLGNLYSDQGKLAEAEAMYQRAFEGYEKALGPEHISTLGTVNNLGLLYSDQGKLAEAEAMYHRALGGKEKALGPEHTSTLDTVNNLGNLYSIQGKLGKAEAMYQRALEGKEKALGPEHTSTLNIVSNLGSLYKDQGKLAKAEAMYQRALEGYEKALGPEHISTLGIVNNLGLLYSDQGKLAEVEAMYQRALEGYEKALGHEHTSTSNTAYNLASLYQQQKKYQESIALFQQAESGDRAVLESQHHKTKDALARIEKVQRLQKLV